MLKLKEIRRRMAVCCKTDREVANVLNQLKKQGNTWMFLDCEATEYVPEAPVTIYLTRRGKILHNMYEKGTYPINTYVDFYELVIPEEEEKRLGRVILEYAVGFLFFAILAWMFIARYPYDGGYWEGNREDGYEWVSYAEAAGE